MSILRPKRPKKRDPEPRSCTLCARGLDHLVFITAPPGWGSMVTCSPTTRRYGVVVRDQDEIDTLRAERAG